MSHGMRRRDHRHQQRHCSSSSCCCRNNSNNSKSKSKSSSSLTIDSGPHSEAVAAVQQDAVHQERFARPVLTHHCNRGYGPLHTGQELSAFVCHDELVARKLDERHSAPCSAPGIRHSRCSGWQQHLVAAAAARAFCVKTMRNSMKSGHERSPEH